MIFLGYVILGILLLLVPHFVLPMHFLHGGRGASLLGECSVWYHPEFLFGLLLAAAGLLSLRWRRLALLGPVVGLAGLAQAAICKPVSYYLRSEEMLVILAQTSSYRSHLHLRSWLIGFSLAAILLYATDLLWRRRRERQHVSRLVLALGNFRRKPFRSTALVLSLAVVIGSFFADVLLTRSIGNSLEIGAGRLGAELIVVPAGHSDEANEVLINGTPHVFSMDAGLAGRVAALPGVEKVSPQLFFRPFSYLVCCITEQVLLVGYDPETDFTVQPWVQYYLRKQQADRELVVGARVKFYPGQQISLFGRLLAVVASLDPTGLGYFDRTAFLPLSGARDLIAFLKSNQKQAKVKKRKESQDLSFTHLFESEEVQKQEMEAIDPEGISALFVRTTPDTDVKGLAEIITTRFPETEVLNIRAASLSVKRQLTSMLDAMMLPILILIGMGTLILTAIFSMSAAERRREVGMLRAMGATRLDIFRIFLMETTMVAGLGGVFGILGGGALLVLFKNRIMASLNLMYIWPGMATIAGVVGLTLVVAVAIGICAGLYPALKSARREPYQAVREG